MNGALKNQSPSLIYIKVSQMIENNILRGIYLENEQVPSTNELARAQSINPATAGKGVNLLVADGILYKKRGIGMFVSPNARELIRQKYKSNFYNSRIKPLVKEGRSLSISDEEFIEMVTAALKERGDPPVSSQEDEH